MPGQVVVRVHSDALRTSAATVSDPFDWLVREAGAPRVEPLFDSDGAVATYDHEGAGASDIVGHGTHVSGIIGARQNDDAGIVGIAGCRLAMWKVFPDQPVQGSFYVDGTTFLRALNAVARSGAQVL